MAKYAKDPLREEYEKTLPDVLEPKDPLRIARLFIKYHLDNPITFYQSSFYRFEISHFMEQEDQWLRTEVYKFLESKGIKPNSRLVSEVIEALKAETYINERCSLPWDMGKNQPAPDMFAFNNGYLEFNEDSNGQLKKHNSAIFNTVACDYNYNQELPAPEKWMNFLMDITQGDSESIGTLQEWFGYVMTQETRQQIMLLIVGPKRSGKSTIARVLRGVIGPSNTTALTLNSFGSPFGLSGLIGKRLATVSDARFGRQTEVQVIAERILSITGEDPLPIQRKFKSDWIGKIPARIMWLANELPRISDAGSALISRFLIIILKKSFLGEEDRNLTEKLLLERPSIANWSLEGLKRLQERGHFNQPSTGLDSLQTIGELGSPISAFVKDECVIKPGLEIPVADLYDRWKTWNEDQGQYRVSPKNIFGRDLQAAVPTITVIQPSQHGSRYRAYRGIALRDSIPDESSSVSTGNEQNAQERINQDHSTRTREAKNDNYNQKESVPLSARISKKLNESCSGLDITPDQLTRYLSHDDTVDIESGKIDDEELRTWAEHYSKKM